MEPSEIRILIVAGRQEDAARWVDLLGQSGVEIWTSREEIPPTEWPDVIVTDSNDVDDRDAGVVRIGGPPTDGPGPTEVGLPEEVTPGELQRACRLLAEIVRLRRRLSRGDDVRRRLSAEALTDHLTRLPNRRAWEQALEERLAGDDASGRLCVAMFDLDLFKGINDAHGHAVGDEVLRAASRAIRGGLCRDDFVARLGGDEFGLLLSVRDEAAAMKVVERVRAALPRQLTEAGVPAVAASAGFHVVPSSVGSSPEQLYATVAAALREAKQRGRGQTVAG